VWEGVPFDPSTVSVCTLLHDSLPVAASEMQGDKERGEEEEEEERDGQRGETEVGGEEHQEVENKKDKTGEEVSQETHIMETDGEQMTRRDREASGS